MNDIPPLGFGTWQITGPPCADAVADALDLGYRHIDTARMYGNEAEVGDGLRRAGTARDEVWITTKLGLDDVGAEQVPEAVEDSLRQLGTDYVDLLLIHWPSDSVPLEETLGAMARARDEGKVRHLGVSNFPSELVRRAAAIEDLLTDQVEYHVHLGQEAVLEACRENGMVLTAYSPIAQGKVLDDPVLVEIAERHDATPAQVALRWLLDQPQVIAVPKAASHRNRALNLQAQEIELSGEDRERIDALPKDRRLISPSWAPRWDERSSAHA